MSVDFMNSKSEPPVDVAYQLTTRLTELEAKVETDKNSIWARTGAVAGVFGLFLSIINGAFTLVDQLIWRPDEEKIGEYNAFKGDVRSLISIDEDLLKQSNNPMVLAYANQKKQSVLQDVNRLLRLLGPSASAKDGKYFIGSYDYNILSQASYQGGNVEAALRFSKDAVQAADNTHTRSELLRSQAFMIMQAHGASGLPEADQALDDAESDLNAATNSEMPIYAVAFDRAALYVTRFGFDLALGKCTDAADQAKKALSIVSYQEDPSLRAAYQGTAAQLNDRLQQVAHSCPISFFASTMPNLPGSAAAQPGGPSPASAPGSAAARNGARRILPQSEVTFLRRQPGGRRLPAGADRP